MITDDREIRIKYDKANSPYLEVQALLLAPKMLVRKSTPLANKTNIVNKN